MRSLFRVVLSTALTTLIAVGFASPAAAHVRVSATTDAEQGGYGVLTFRLPTESDSASTTELRVTLPADHPFFMANTQPKPGWTATVTKKDLPTPQTDHDGGVHTQYVSQVDWKADNLQAAIPPKQFDMFNINVGPLPMEASLTLPAEQFYSDGHSVNWNESTVAGEPKPKHPAPVLTLGSGTCCTDMTTPGAPSYDSASVWLGGIALVVAAMALSVACANFVLRRRS